MVQARAGLRHTVIHTDINPYKIKKISASWDFRYLVYRCQCSVVVELLSLISIFYVCLVAQNNDKKT